MSSDIDELMRKHITGDIDQPSLTSELIEITVFIITSTIIGIIFFTLTGAILSIIFAGELSLFDEFGGNISFIVMIITGIYAALGFFAGRGTYYGEMQRRAWTGAGKKFDGAQRDLIGFLSQTNFMYRLFIGSLASLLMFYIFIP